NHYEMHDNLKWILLTKHTKCDGQILILVLDGIQRKPNTLVFAKVVVLHPKKSTRCDTTCETFQGNLVIIFILPSSILFSW
ncbi:hypothetical protein ACJX0J_023430, partial [Zea mays]